MKRDGSGVFTAIFNNQQHWAHFCSVVVIGMLENPREALPVAIWEFHMTSGQRSSLRQHFQSVIGRLKYVTRICKPLIGHCHYYSGLVKYESGIVTN